MFETAAVQCHQERRPDETGPPCRNCLPNDLVPNYGTIALIAGPRLPVVGLELWTICLWFSVFFVALADRVTISGTFAAPLSNGLSVGALSGTPFDFSPFAVDYYVIDSTQGFLAETDVVNPNDPVAGCVFRLLRGANPGLHWLSIDIDIRDA